MAMWRQHGAKSTATKARSGLVKRGFKCTPVEKHKVGGKDAYFYGIKNWSTLTDKAGRMLPAPKSKR